MGLRYYAMRALRRKTVLPRATSAPGKIVKAEKACIDDPWLDFLVSGPKTHEGRLCRNMWAKVAPGDRLDAYSDRYDVVEFRVTEVLHFTDFDQAFAALGKRLVPEGADTPEEALQLYRRWNSAEAVQQCGGVVAVGLQVIGAVRLREHVS